MLFRSDPNAISCSVEYEITVVENDDYISVNPYSQSIQMSAEVVYSNSVIEPEYVLAA